MVDCAIRHNGTPFGNFRRSHCNQYIYLQCNICQRVQIKYQMYTFYFGRGRKKAALTYVVAYTLGCATKHWNNFSVLLVGRLFCGVATSLLYSAFESWLVAEHFKVNSWSPDIQVVFLVLMINADCLMHGDVIQSETHFSHPCLVENSHVSLVWLMWGSDGCIQDLLTFFTLSI